MGEGGKEGAIFILSLECILSAGFFFNYKSLYFFPEVYNF